MFAGTCWHAELQEGDDVAYAILNDDNSSSDSSLFDAAGLNLLWNRGMLQLAVHLYVFARHACFLILPVRSLLPCLADLGTRCEAYLNGVLDELVSENITAEMDDDTLSLQTAAGHEATRLVAEFQQNVADGRLAIFSLGPGCIPFYTHLPSDHGI